MILWTARFTLLLGAVASWRWSRRISLACAIAFAASLAYLVAPVEPLRWVSALVGYEGLAEAVGAAAVAVRGAKSPREAVARFERRGWLGAICVASMASDGVALFSWRAAQVWPMAYTQIGWSLLLITVGVWPTRRSPRCLLLRSSCRS